MGFAISVNLLVAQEKLLQKHNTKSKTICFCFSSCMAVFLSDTVDLWVKDFGYTRDLQKVSTLLILQLYFTDDYKNKIIFLHNHLAFQYIFPSILPTV
jgi:hypothetical protein